ncbi:MAG: hypothetical protein WKF75_11410, partial [Singulisphaera sp.]
MAAVVSPGPALKTVTYTITGGAILSQNYTKPQGGVTRYTAAVSHTPNPANDSLKFYWDEHQGQHSLTVSVMYDTNNPENNGQPYTKTFTFSVEQPKVESYGYNRNSGLLFGNRADPGGGGNTIGFFQNDPGNYFTPAVTTYNFGGTFALMERTDLVWTRKGKTSGPIEVKSGAYVLDPTPVTNQYNNQPLMLRGWNTQVGVNQFDVDLEYLANQGPTNQMKTPPEAHYLRDNPEVYARARSTRRGLLDGDGATWSFHTSNVSAFRGTGLLALSIEDQRLRDLQGQPGNPKSRRLPRTSTIARRPRRSGTMTETEIPTWTDQFSTYDNQYHEKGLMAVSLRFLTVALGCYLASATLHSRPDGTPADQGRGGGQQPVSADLGDSRMPSPPIPFSSEPRRLDDQGHLEPLAQDEAEIGRRADVRAWTTKKQFRMLEPIPVHLRVRNTSDRTMTLAKPHPPGVQSGPRFFRARR